MTTNDCCTMWWSSLSVHCTPLYCPVLTVDASNLGGVVGKCQLLFPYEAGQYGAGEVVSDKRYVTHVPLSFTTSHQHIQYMILIDIHVILVLFHWQKPLFTGWCVTPLVSESSEARDNSLLTYVAAVCHMKTVCHCCSTGRCSFSHASILCNL